MHRRQPWPAIAAWLVVAGLGLPAVSRALEGRGGPLVTAVAIECWAVWGLTWVALLVPRSTTLTVTRLGVPTALVVAIGCAMGGAGTDVWVPFLVAALVALAALLHGSTVDAFVDGSSYGPEERFALRTPLLLSLTAVPLSWAVAVSILTAPVLFAVGNWVAGVLVTIVWAVGAWPSVRSLHLLARRWVVLVPAGLVLSDPLTLADSLLLPRRTIGALGPAYAGTDATIVSQETIGLRLQADLSEPIGLGLRQGRESEPRELATDRLVFAPIRPGALLRAAASHRIAVGETLPDASGPSCVRDGMDPDPASGGPTGGDEAATPQQAVPLPRTRSPR